MKKTILSLMLAAISAQAFSADSGFTAADVLVNMNAKTLDILTESQRKDMLDYYTEADSVYNVLNVMEGFSHLNPPVKDDYLQVQITPVTCYTIRILPYKDKKLAMTLYTVGDSVMAHDTEIRFYDMNMNELKRDKFIKTLSTEDFFDFKGVDGKLKKEILQIIPFPTVEYSITPDGNKLKADLTVGAFLTKEDLEKVSPYMRRIREYRWDGSKWHLID